MINITFHESKDQEIQSVVISGHAESGQFGQDLVCAGVSTLAISTLNYLEHTRLADPAEVEADEEEGGYLSYRLSKKLSDDQVRQRALIVDYLKVSLQELAKEYPKYVSLSIRKAN